MNMHSVELFRQNEAHKARQARLWGKKERPAPASRLMVIDGRKPRDASYHVVLYRAYQERLRETFTMGASFTITTTAEYCPYTSEIEFAPEALPPKTMRQVALEVLAGFPGVSLDEVKGKRRVKALAVPRQLVMYEIARQLPNKSYPEIGRFLGGRDHTTILHAVRKMKALYENDADSEAWMARKERGNRESHARNKAAHQGEGE